MRTLPACTGLLLFAPRKGTNRLAVYRTLLADPRVFSRRLRKELSGQAPPSLLTGVGNRSPLAKNKVATNAQARNHIYTAPTRSVLTPFLLTRRLAQVTIRDLVPVSTLAPAITLLIVGLLKRHMRDASTVGVGWCALSAVPTIDPTLVIATIGARPTRWA